MSAEKATTGLIGNSLDFCQLFSMEVDSLYALALLLTRKHDAAERCLLAGLEDCLRARPVWENSVRSPGRWSVIRQAAIIVSSSADLKTVQPSDGLDARHMGNPVMQAIAKLPVLERFAFVLTVLERFPVRECATLLSCKSRDVIQARVRAMRAISAALETSAATIETSVATTAMVAA